MGYLPKEESYLVDSECDEFKEVLSPEALKIVEEYERLYLSDEPIYGQNPDDPNDRKLWTYFNNLAYLKTNRSIAGLCMILSENLESTTYNANDISKMSDSELAYQYILRKYGPEYIRENLMGEREKNQEIPIYNELLNLVMRNWKEYQRFSYGNYIDRKIQCLSFNLSSEEIQRLKDEIVGRLKREFEEASNRRDYNESEIARKHISTEFMFRRIIDGPEKYEGLNSIDEGHILRKEEEQQRIERRNTRRNKFFSLFGIKRNIEGQNPKDKNN